MIKKLIFSFGPGRLFLKAGLLFSFLFFLLLLQSCAVSKQRSATNDKTVSSRPARVDIDQVNTLFMDAVQNVMLDQTDSAFSGFSRVVQLQPDNAAAHFQLSKLWLKKNNLPKAIESIKLAHKLAPGNKWISQRYAELSSVEGNFKLAAAIYAELAKNDPAPEEYLVRQAMTLQQADDFRGALDVLNQLKKYAGDDDETVLLQRRKLFLEIGRVDSAITETELLIRYYPEKPEYRLLLAALYFKDRQHEKGLDVFHKADQAFPASPLVQEAFIRYYLEKQDTSQLKDYLEDIFIRRREPISDKLDVLSLFVNARQHDTLAKILSYEYAAKLAAQEPSEQEAVLFYGYLLDADGNKDSALVQFQKAIAIDSTQYPPWQQILMTFGERMQADSLISYGSRAAAIFPDNPVLYYFESVGYLLNKNYKDAVTALRLGLQNANPDDTSLIVQFHASLGDAYQELKDPGAADSSYQLALRLQPDNVTVLNNYSYFLSQQGVKLREAEQMSAKTIRARPEEGTFLDTYGWILYKQGRFKEAKKYLELALDHMELKGSGVTNEHLGDAEYKLGNPKKAMQYWMKAKATGGGSDMLDYKIKNGRLHD